jgi:NAD(P)-dependent dehydrogenase (short-subunit alcohol dehydrogenase family)
MATYVITGGASGIGAAIAKQLQSEGNRIVTVDIKEADILADLSTAEGRQGAIEAIREATADGIKGLVTSAGLGSHVPDNGLITRVNYAGTVDLIEGLREHLASNNADVLLISSNSAPMQTNPEFIEQLLAGDLEAAVTTAQEMDGQPVYSGTKQAVTIWMRRNAAAYAADGIRMNAIGPGYTRTPLSAAVEDDPTYGDAIKQFIASIPVGRPGVPDDMADAASFLLGERAGFICGAMLFVDGGHDAMMRPDNF